MLFVLEPKHAQLGYVLHVLFVLKAEHAELGSGYVLHVLLVFQSNMHKRGVLCATAV